MKLQTFNYTTNYLNLSKMIWILEEIYQLQFYQSQIVIVRISTMKG